MQTLVGPLLRVEVTLRRKNAVAWWPFWKQSSDDGFAAAAGHIQQMTGLAVQEATREVGQFVKPEGSTVAEHVAQFVRQNGDKLAAFEKAGFPVVQLAKEHSRRPASRMKAKRDREREDELRRVDVDETVSLVRRLLSLTQQD